MTPCKDIKIKTKIHKRQILTEEGKRPPRYKGERIPPCEPLSRLLFLNSFSFSLNSFFLPLSLDGERAKMRVDNKGEKKTPPYDPLKTEKIKDKDKRRKTY